MPSSKGAGFITVTEVMRDGADATRWKAFVQALPEATAALVEHPPLAVAWIDIEHFSALIETGCRVLYNGKPEALTDVARRAIARDLNGLYRIFIRLASPAFVVEKAAQVWSKYYRDHGTFTTERRSERAVRAIYRGMSIGSPAFWAYQRGALLAPAEATGQQGVNVALESGGGKSDAVFVVSW